MIYWLRAGDTEAVKVGYAMDVQARIAELQAGSPLLLVLLRVEGGGRKTEAALHRHYAAKRILREWFALDAADIAYDVAQAVVTADPGERRLRRVQPVAGVAAAIDAVGSAAALAKACGVTRFAVQQWKERGIPPRQVGRVAQVTGLHLHELRSDLFLERAA